jgi:hypothetical protein
MRIFQNSASVAEDQSRFHTALWFILGVGLLTASAAIAIYLAFSAFVPRFGIIAHRAVTSAHFVRAPNGQYTYSYVVDGRSFSSVRSTWADASPGALIEIQYDREKPWNSVPNEPEQLNLQLIAMLYGMFILMPAAAGTVMIVLARKKPRNADIWN